VDDEIRASPMTFDKARDREAHEAQQRMATNTAKQGANKGQEHRYTVTYEGDYVEPLNYTRAERMKIAKMNGGSGTRQRHKSGPLGLGEISNNW
jgi:hypothetical protein